MHIHVAYCNMFCPGVGVFRVAQCDGCHVVLSNLDWLRWCDAKSFEELVSLLRYTISLADSSRAWSSDSAEECEV
jgi:hypothetical protein